jgi:hypothetical protein
MKGRTVISLKIGIKQDDEMNQSRHCKMMDSAVVPITFKT